MKLERPFRKLAIALLIGCALIGASLLVPFKIYLTSDRAYSGVLVELIDKEGKAIDSFIVDNQLQLDSFYLVKLLVDGVSLHLVHPLLKAQNIELNWGHFYSKNLNVTLVCWCADKSYPKQEDLVAVFAHFADIKSQYIPKVPQMIRRESVAEHSKALYMLVAVASDRVGEGRKLNKRNVRERKNIMAEVIDMIYIDP
ncbi:MULTISPECIES: hypothetical protein [Pseudoalteromonas]|uniref:hypothetical protein n=1 Tax=Pseudoalteromonas TaxID=53246 RepID=UPI000FFF1533|nr:MULTISPECIES: hypothetical protein [Pseudoalteromonas]MCG9761551.1 hypothetical protein [Pseudoalteromonas sp. Isolate6]MCG9770213.1 hypothetical protein [Pseudoalteromonas piscicida]NKC21457.1 hypothetical protein [Pseudoalteromonas galatheae]RXE87656.1 hypothetical protein DRB05_06745 [Pseudoalteromonas sp. A757]